MTNTVPPVQIDNFIELLCRVHILSIKGVIKAIDTGVVEEKLGKAGVKDVFSLATQAGLLDRRVGIYHITDSGTRLCNIYKESQKSQELWMELHHCLQRINPYREFIDYLSEPKNVKDAKAFKGKTTTAKTMIRWLKRMNMLNEYESDNTIQYIPPRQLDIQIEEEFINSVKMGYEKVAQKAGLGWRGTFISIQELKEEICRKLIIDHKKFEPLFTELLNSEHEGLRIRLAKGPGTAYGLRRTSAFEWDGQKYLYIAVDEVGND